jgi:hypothetical protein
MRDFASPSRLMTERLSKMNLRRAVGGRADGRKLFQAPVGRRMEKRSSGVVP